MTTIHNPIKPMSKCANDALIDQLRACQTADDILKFEEWFNSNIAGGQLSELICDLLRNRSISRAVAAKWFSTLLNDREMKLNKKSSL